MVFLATMNLRAVDETYLADSAKYKRRLARTNEIFTRRRQRDEEKKKMLLNFNELVV